MNGFRAAALDWVKTGVYTEQGGQGMEYPATKIWREREERAQRHKDKAADLWAAMDDNQKHGVRFGLFPQVLMAIIPGDYDQHLVVVELMAIASANGGMRA